MQHLNQSLIQFAAIVNPCCEQCCTVSISSSYKIKIQAIKKGKVFPYSLPSIGLRADPGVQAVSPQVTKPSPGSRLPLITAIRLVCGYLPN